MSMVVPNVGEVKALQLILNRPLTLKLYSNNYIPVEGTTVAAFTETVGGGYASKSLDGASWTIIGGDPTIGTYAVQEFVFTDVVGGSGSIYGYYVEDADGVCMWAERFDETRLPFIPVAGTKIQITPKFQGS